jgi:hypothetical protein
MGTTLAIEFRKKFISMPIDFVCFDSCTIHLSINWLAVDPRFNYCVGAVFTSIIFGVNGLLGKVTGTA